MQELVAESVARYREMLGVVEEIESLDLGRLDEVQRLADRLQRLQEEAAVLDARIGDVAEPAADLFPLLRERHGVMVEIERRNRLLSPRIEAMMAVLLAELNDLRTGMSAMAGYRTGAGEKGSRLRDAY